MTAGLLTQPRHRKGEFVGNREELQIKRLKAQVTELELVIATQTKLIEIFRSIPGYEGVTLKDDGTSGVSRRIKKKSGIVAKKRSTREPGDFSASAEGQHANDKIVEEPSPSPV
jgi:hypothetical protein